MKKAGQRLEDERLKRGLTLSDVSNATKIREEFLAFIEKSDYKNLPSAAYAKGFVGSYAKFLNIPEKEILALFKREFDEEKELKVLPEGLAGKKDISIHMSKIKQAAVFVVLIILALFGYIVFQYRYAFINPPLDIDSPKEMANLFSPTVTVSGKTDPAATVYIGDAVVPVNDDGSFRKEIVEFSGKSTITIKSVNRFGKQATIVRHIVIK